MAETISSRQARAWNVMREHYQQLKLDVDMATPATPLDQSEADEMALELARRDFLALDAPHIDGVCERIILAWGEKLFDEEDPDMDFLRSIVGNLRLLAAETA